ncbi:GNAT family N-acetyltransferase [Tumebacillus permanentifrigoris]|uniref:Acetyltransferase (GNAT) family protein n=1 Tax=Tumebacillus permanentifrigoris TaxID=378543 RepID=A0A316DFD3_9BACL|nr:GNAT family N-acetyltransferase [Tumebacillus permanentifrigoris]PWK16426.1 acetyltransferase (GNAT) family protein [Tumebacillus permanentifrigoris]
MRTFNDFDWEVLDRRKHDVQDFSSGFSVFDEHIRIDAILQQSNGLSQTRVFTNGKHILAYYTAKCTKLQIDDTEQSGIGSKEKTVPAIEIPMLAVDQRLHRQGIGEELLQEILYQSVTISQLVGCRYLFLRAIKLEWLIRWYKDFGFKEIPFEVIDEFTQPMSFKLPTVQELSEEEFESLF